MGIPRWLVPVGLAWSSSVIGAPPAAEIQVVDLGWPATTTAATVRHAVHVLDGAERGKRIGVMAAGTRVTWRHLVASRDGCRAWVELEPRGWACARDLAPTDKPAIAARVGDSHWADIRTDGADAFDDLDAIKAATPSHHVGDKTYVALRGSGAVNVGGTRYYYTDQGWIESRALAWYEPSPFAGVELTLQTPLDFGWAVAHRPGAKIEVRDAGKAVVRKLSPRDRVPVLEVKDGLARIGTDEWVDVTELRIPEAHARPEGIAPTEHWLDVDLDQQLLIAFEGDTAVFVTLVSTGRTDWATPTGIYRIRGKDAISRMQDPGGMAEAWNVADVPWSMRFRRNFALHGTYWHDGFGRQRSHGCVNLSTADAKRIYDWVTPLAPAGWTEVESAGDGTPVRIHSHREPDPVWRDFDGVVIDPRRPSAALPTGVPRSSIK